MNLKKNIFFNIILTVSNLIFPLLSFPYASRVLGPEGTGEVSFAQAFCQNFIFIAALGIPVYGVREIAKLRTEVEDRSNLFVEINIVRIIATAITLVPYFITIFLIDKFSQNITLYLWGSVLILINILSFEWFFSGLEDFKFITIRSVITKLFSLVLLFIFVKERGDRVAFFNIYMFTFVVGGVINIQHLFKYFSIEHINWRKLRIKRHLKPLFLIFGGIMAINIYALSDTILLGLLDTDKSVGLYSASSKIVKIPLAIITSLGAVLVSRISFALSNRDFNDVDKLLGKSLQFVYTFGIPMSVGLFCLAPELITLFSGVEFSNATSTIRILCALIPIIGLANIFSVQILTPLSKDNLVLRSALIGSGISIILNIILIPLLKANGSAIANVSVELIVTILLYIYARQHIQFNLKLGTALMHFFCAIPYILIVYLLRIWTEQASIIVIATVCLSGVLFLITQIFLLKNELLIENFNMLINKYKKVETDPSNQ